MNGLKAVVLEKNGNMLTVLCSDGSFQKVRYKDNVEIGEEIKIPTARQIPFWRIGASVAAIFLIVFMGVFGWNVFQPGTAVAMLSVDINPSLQLTLDRKGRVLELESLNPDAEQLLSGLPLKGEPWDEALKTIIKQSVEMHYLNPEHNWVVVGYSPLTAELEPLEAINTEEITKHIDGAAVEKGLNPKIAIYELSADEQVKAQETGLTLGEYALVNTAQKAGVKVEPGDVKKANERVRLLEKPEIQEQIQKDNRLKKDSKKALPNTANPEADKENNSEKANEKDYWNDRDKKDHWNDNNEKDKNEKVKSDKSKSNDDNDSDNDNDVKKKESPPGQSQKTEGNSHKEKDSKKTEKSYPNT